MVRFSGTKIECDDLFKLSDVASAKVRSHTPFIAFVPEEDGGVKVCVEQKLADVLRLRDDVQLMVQWQGRWRSDFFNFTVGDLRAVCK